MQFYFFFPERLNRPVPTSPHTKTPGKTPLGNIVRKAVHLPLALSGSAEAWGGRGHACLWRPWGRPRTRGLLVATELSPRICYLPGLSHGWADAGPESEPTAARATRSREHSGSGEAFLVPCSRSKGHFYPLHVRQNLCQLPKTPLQI